MKGKRDLLRFIPILALLLFAAAVMTSGAWAEEEIFIESPEPAHVEASEYSVPGADDSGDLLWGYLESSVQKQLNPAPLLRGVRPSSVSGNDAIVLSELKAAASDIASGDRTSTIVEISLSKLGIDLEKYTYHPSDGNRSYVYIPETDLDLSGKVFHLVGDTYEVDEEIAEEGYKKLLSYIDYDVNKVLSSLLAECPYEMFWAKKKIADHPDNEDNPLGYGVTGEIIDGEIVGYFYFTLDHINVYLKAAPGYALTDGETVDEYTVDASKIDTVNKAVKNARAVIDEAAVQCTSDYEILKYYKEWICDNTSYNYKALAAGNSDAFGDINPWQMIWVFDDDEETEVVCEGYSKAFQYLCDNTVFYDDDIYCFCPSGLMNGGTGAGRHMWNIVRMDDGKYYLVDVTNCDGNSIGAPDHLFLKGYSDIVTDDNGTWYLYTWENIASRDNPKVLYKYNDNQLFSAEELAVENSDYVPVVSHQLSLGGKIGVIFNLGEGITADENSISATIDGKAIDTEYKSNSITCYVNSIQMAEPITLVFKYTKGEDTTTYEYDGKYSAMDYIRAVNASDSINGKTKNLVKQLHNYGYWIRQFLELVHGSEVYENYELMDKVDFEGIEINNGEDFKPVCSGLSSSGITASYLLRFDSGTDIVISLDGDIQSIQINGESYTGDLHKIVIKDILPQYLANEYVVTINKKATIRISALSYIWLAMNSDEFGASDNETISYITGNAMASLFNYYVAASKYNIN